MGSGSLTRPIDGSEIELNEKGGERLQDPAGRDVTRTMLADAAGEGDLQAPCGILTYLYTGDVGEVVRLQSLESVRRAAGSPARIQVYAALRQAIVRGELEPGQQISENALAANLGVSRTPVREALARLRDDRLVEIVPQLGTFVSRISPQAVS